MTLIDEIKLQVQSGSGGDGVVRWIRNRRVSKGGPAGGDGGRGGNIIIRAVRDTSRLSKYRGNTFFKAGDGEAGGKNSLHGHHGNDITIDLPIGSIITLKRQTEDEKVTSDKNDFKQINTSNTSNTSNTFELLTEGEEHIILLGGAGGFGNEHFKSSRNVTPQEFTVGKIGEQAELNVELKLIADLGLVGKPNAGKSSLLNALTNANSKVGNYTFTTLEPHLGEMFGYIIADIPGLIEGASEGKGLGYTFLRHIARTRAIIVCISVEQDDIISSYRAILTELYNYDPRFKLKPLIIVLTKTDLISKDEIAKEVSLLKKLNLKVSTVTILDDDSIKKLRDTIISFLTHSVDL